MDWPQITWIVIASLGLGVELSKHGQPRTGTRNAWVQLFATLFAAWLLWSGGFFGHAHAAQPPAAAQQYRNDVIRSARLDWGINAPIADFAAQLHQESGWNPRAVSPVGAQGLAQFMPTTSDWFSRIMPGLRANQPFNPAWAIRALTSYDRWLWERVSARNDCERMAMTLSSYNGGLGWVQRDQRLATQRGLDRLRWFDHVETVNAGRSSANWRENRHYPDRILHQLAQRYLTWGGRSCAETI